MNNITLTGMISDIANEGNHMVLLVKQKVASKMPTGFPIALKKEDFEMLNLQIGESIALFNGSLWLLKKGENDERYRISITNPSQIKKITRGENDFVSLTFQGKVLAKKEEEKKSTIAMELKYFNKHSKTEDSMKIFLVLSPEMAKKIQKDDIYTVVNAEFYQNNGEFFARVKDKSQIVLKHRKTDLGIINVDQVFI